LAASGETGGTKKKFLCKLCLNCLPFALERGAGECLFMWNCYRPCCTFTGRFY